MLTVDIVTPHSHTHDHNDVKGISWAGLFFGLLLHTLVDGVALASSVLADACASSMAGIGGLRHVLGSSIAQATGCFCDYLGDEQTELAEAGAKRCKPRFLPRLPGWRTSVLLWSDHLCL